MLEVITSLSIIIPVIVAGFIALKREFDKAATKVEQVHMLVNSQLDEAISERDKAREQIREEHKHNVDLQIRINELLLEKENKE